MRSVHLCWYTCRIYNHRYCRCGQFWLQGVCTACLGDNLFRLEPTESPVMDLPGLTRVGEYVPISSDNLAQIIESGMKGRD